MGRDASAEAMLREAEVKIEKTGNDGLLIDALNLADQILGMGRPVPAALDC